MFKKFSFLEQVRQNSVALISLVVAVTSLGYNTWRNEVTEANRNVRVAGFQLVEKMIELQATVLFTRFPGSGDVVDNSPGDYRRGWAYALAIKDLSFNMPPEVQKATDHLYETWENEFETIARDEASYEKMDAAINDARMTIVEAIARLD